MEQFWVIKDVETGRYLTNDSNNFWTKDIKDAKEFPTFGGRWTLEQLQEEYKNAPTKPFDNVNLVEVVSVIRTNQ